MSMGAQRAEAQSEHGTAKTSQPDWVGLPETDHQTEGGEAIASGLDGEARSRPLAVVLMVLAAAWTAAAIWSIARASPPLTLVNLLQWISFIAPPLILFGIAWLIVGRTSRRETDRFVQAVSAMRHESSALESVLAIVATRLEENHARLRGEASKLMSLGDEASDRLGRVAHYLSKESASLDKKAQALESAAEAARVDIGVLLQDLPRAAEQARGVSAAMKDAGLTAHGHAGALEGQLSALVARGREADEVVGGAAHRLAAHLARVESTAAAATARLDEAAASMTAAVDDTMVRAAEAIDATRSSLDAQSAALFAAIEQNRAALQHAGDDAARNIRHRLDAVGEKIETLAGHLAAQDVASHALLGSLTSELAALDESFAELGRTGTGNTERLGQSIATVRASVSGLSEDLAGGQDRAAALIGRAHEMAQALGGVAAQLNGDVPEGLIRVEEQAARAHQAVAQIMPNVAAMEAASTAASARIAEAEAGIARQQELLQSSGTALAAYLMERLGEVESKLAALRETGGNSALELGETITAVRASVSELTESLDGNRDRAQGLADRAEDLSTALAVIGAALDEALPASLAQVETQAERARAAAAALAPEVESIRLSSDTAAMRFAEAEAGLERQQALLQSTSGELAGGLLQRLAEIEEKLGTLRELGGNSSLELEQAVTNMGASLTGFTEALGGNSQRVEDLAGRTRDINAALTAMANALDEALPASLSRIEEQASRARESASAMAPEVEAVRISADSAATTLGEAEASIRRQREALDAMLTSLREGAASAEAQLQALGGAAHQADEAAGKMVSQTGPELIDALLRVREAANQAAERARDTIAAVIPQSAAALASASRDALSDAVSGPVEEQIGALHRIAEQAVETARKASERLTRQMLRIGETTAAVEARIDEARKDREEKDAESFSRRVALLIESLNSTAIDVTKILSNEVTDSAWAAYLKGDRGVFTRRAVRLIDNAEAREIIQHYEAEPDFREQVNRYIHDFEAMLRRVLADRDGSALAVTILSSDMGKLYVALAQAIERLR